LITNAKEEQAFMRKSSVKKRLFLWDDNSKMKEEKIGGEKT
jgi:hypothetical protein